MRSRQITYVKTSRGGEHFWCRVTENFKGGVKAVVDNHTIDPQAPRLGEPIEIPSDEILDCMIHRQTFGVIEGGLSDDGR
jgi:hypothetical protein